MDFALVTAIVAASGGLAAGVGGSLAWGAMRRRVAARRLVQDMTAAIENLVDGVALFDGRSRLVLCNRAYRVFFRPIADQIKPGIRFDDLMAIMARGLGRDESWLEGKQESWHSGISGHEDEVADGHWVGVHTYPLQDGAQLRVLRDITQRRQVQDSLESTVAWLKGVMDTVGDGIIAIDESGTVLSFNSAAERIFGFNADEVVGRGLSMLMPAPFNATHQNHISTYMRTGVRRIIGAGREVRGMRRDGSIFPLDISVTEMRQGDMVTFIGVLRDITQRKRFETALIDGEARFRAQATRLQAIIDNMAQGVAVFASDDTLIALNEAARRMLALPSAQIMPGSIDISLFLALLAVPDPHGDSEEVVRLTTDLTNNIRQRSDLVFEHVSEQGTVMEVRSSPMPGGGLILSFTDITDRKRTEQTLREAKEAAERGNRAKNTFLANISHELRTPLNAIIGFSEMMKHEIFGPLEPASYRPYLDDIHDSGMHLLELINDILDLSKAEAGMTDLAETLVDVGGIVRGSVRMLARRAANAGLTITPDLPERLPLLLADERRMRQIVLNLLSNAVKFTDDGGRVTISARTGTDGFIIEVSDSGIGMTPDELERVMEPFVQADARLSRKYEGSGLGLPLTKALVEAHGGLLTLDSESGRGTVATVVFPAARIVASDSATL
ncbi:sensor histidine kinase [Magnetospirillum molischianum]|uniref:Sensor protein FixL n=1 Tax=Magnetospirillum molischianum DSM 120 TaxID=1150626 RepID=H8FSJ6_MAGML|nr:PAS-domain containing protein [Magnetospirillum molischianum]CCG41334.1 Putative two-component sensor histidine kinase, classical system [Magnetospirillum molischianum DSM 120]